MDTQSNWGSGNCELSNCYDFGIEEFAVVEFNGDDVFNPLEDPDGIASILINVFNDGPYCSQYPGLMITTDLPGITFPYLNVGPSEEFLTFWYGIPADGTYFANIPFELSPFVPIDSEIIVTMETVTMNCYEESCIEDPYCHECPLTPPVSFSVVVGDLFPNTMGDANIDGDLNVLDIVSIIEYILNVDQSNFNYDSNQLFITLVDINDDYYVDILDIVQIIDLILNNL